MGTKCTDNDDNRPLATARRGGWKKRPGFPALVANLDFEARVPVPFSVFPRTYKEAEAETTTKTHEELEINLPERAGREGQYSSGQAQAPRREQRFSEEEVRYTREEERYRRPGDHREYYEEPSYEESRHHHHHHHHQPAHTTQSETFIEVDHQHKPHYSTVDRIEREYRARAQPSVYREDIRVTDTVDVPPQRPSYYGEQTHVTQDTVDASAQRPYYGQQHARVTEETIDVTKSSAPRRHQETKITEETVEYPRHSHSSAHQKSRMGYYDDSGKYHSFRHGFHKMADRMFHPGGERIEVIRETSSGHGGHASGPNVIPNTITIPCHHIHMGDILMLQGRPCQVIRISTSSATGQHRYLGVDLFTKQLHEESSFVSNPAPSVVVQTMLGPVFKQYRVLDLQDGSVVAITETGDVKTGLPVIDQSNLWSRLSSAFNTGHGSVRVLVLSDHGQELVVDVKTVHGSRL
ncbi:hypothetical protein GGR56DRAFT_666105 [Xylariaceae sp. FL0804]|nr:hypothetical protein GGR56DRAFT_666105 [Xylariaceae sp. FL0804]